MASSWTLREPLQEDDPEISALIKREKERQRCGLELISSEVINLMKICLIYCNVRTLLVVQC